MSLLANIVISAVVGIVATIGAYNFLPLSVIEKFGPETERPLGATITTIQGTDTLRDSRAVINTNFANLNSDKTEVSSSSIAAITTLSNLVTVGTLTSGSLGSGFTTVAVARGGTGSTTLSSNQVLLGNGTGALSVVAGLGSNGQFLTSGGAGTPPTWTTSSIDLAGNYVWTGRHTFQLGATSTASTTIDRLFSRFATTTQATTTYLTVTNTASTSLLVTSLNCTACPGAYTGSSTTYSCASGTCTFTGSIPGNSTYGLGSFAMTGGNEQGMYTLARSGLTTFTALHSSADDQYQITWSGNNFSIEEVTDTGANSSFNGTIYWYR